MTKQEAFDIINGFTTINAHTSEEKVLFDEATKYLVETCKDDSIMTYLGNWYYKQNQFDLAIKYFECAALEGNASAEECLGHIWYYKNNYEKAFKHFENAINKGDDTAAIKIADMYKNGYYATKNYEKYKNIIETLYEKYKDLWDSPEDSYSPIAEVFMRLAEIKLEDGKTDEAISLYTQAKESLKYRISEHPFFDDLQLMKTLIHDLYQLTPFNINQSDFFDLYHLLTTPGTITIELNQQQYEINVEQEEGNCVIEFLDTWYKNSNEFMAKAKYHESLLTEIYYKIKIIGKD